MKNQSACLRPPAALSTFPAAEDLSRLVSSSSDAPADDGERRKAALFGSGRRISNINILPYLPTSLSFGKSLHGFQPSCWVCRNPRLDRLCGLIACVILVFFHTSGQKLLYKVGLIRNLVDFGCERITGLIRLGRRKKQCDLDWKGCNQNSLWICMYAMMYLFLHIHNSVFKIYWKSLRLPKEDQEASRFPFTHP